MAASTAAVMAWAAPGAVAAGSGTPILTPAGVPHPASPVHAKHPFRPRDPAAYARAKLSAQGGRRTMLGPLGPVEFPPAAPKAVVSGALNQPGLASGDNAARNAGTPPDPTGAVGPSHYVEFVNSVVRVYDKNLTTVENTAQLDTFVGATNNAVFDPQIQYDPVADRWFYLADDCSQADCSTGNFLAFGWSKSSDPSDLSAGWCNYFIRTDNGTNGFFDDYPKLGHNNTHLVFGTNVFNTVSFVSSRIWTVPKPAAGTITTCPTSFGTAHYFTGSAASPVKDATNLAGNRLRTSDNDIAFTPEPANTQDSSSNAFVVAADGAPGTQLMVWHISGAAGSEALTADGNVTVSSYSTPASVPQPGTTDVLDSSDTRLTQAVAHADPDAAGAEAIWTQHTIASSGRSAVRWYELIPGNATPRQQGSVTDSSSFVFNGAISPTMAGNEAVVEYNVGGTTQLAQIRASSRISADTLGTVAGEVVLGTSTNADQDFSCPSNDPTAPSCRWGDYAGATPDPSNNHLAWGTNQLLGAPSADNPHWTTRNFGLSTTTGPVASLVISPRPALTGQTVTFDASSSTAAGGIDKYEWDLDGDGTFETDTGTVAQTTTTYSSAQTVNVKLRVTAGVNSDTITRSLTIVSNAPGVSTGSANPVGMTDATLNGTVNPKSQATTYWFEYGTTTAYGTDTTHSSAGSGATDVAESASISGLTRGTLYHFRMVASNGSGTTQGSDQTFTTTDPPIVTTGSASSISSTGATLNGTVDPNGKATTFWFEYGTSTGYGSETTHSSAGSGTSAAAQSATIGGLAQGTTYHFRIVASSADGTTNGSDQTFTTNDPPIVTTGNASSITTTGATLNGTVDTRGQPTTYKFQYGTTAAYGSESTVGTVSTASVSAAISGLTPGTLYHFRVVATNPDGSANGNDRTFTTPGPPVVATTTATLVGETAATLNGTVDPSGLATNYRFEYGTDTSYGQTSPLGSAGNGSTATSVSAAISGLTAGTTYHYRLVASSSAGTVRGSDMTLTTLSAPTGSTDTTSQTPPPGGVTQGPAKAALGLTLAVVRAKLGAVLTKGLRIRPSCGEVCTVTVKLRISANDARRLHLKRTLGTVTGAGGVGLRLRIPKTTARLLEKLQSLRVTLVAGAVAPDGRRAALSKRMTLRR